MKLIDRHFDTLYHAREPEDLKAIRETLTCVDVTNVVKYMYEECDKEYWDYAKDFPSVLSPFTVAWYEAATPKWTNSNGKIVTLNLPPRMGWLVLPIELTKPITAPTENPFLQKLYGYGSPGVQYDDKRSRKEVFVDGVQPRWTQMQSLYMGNDDKIVEIGTRIIYINAEGGMIKDHVIRLGDEPLDGDADRYALALYMSLSFMHCKNVTVDAKPRDEKLDRVLAKRGRPPRFTFRTLNIEPLKKVARQESSGQPTGIKRALHICRGHFADYTEGKGLFGKYHGRFWMPQSVKGSLEAGRADKDYRVKAKGAPK